MMEDKKPRARRREVVKWGSGNHSRVGIQMRMTVKVRNEKH